LTFWDYATGTPFQTMDDVPQPGSLEAEAGVFCSTFDQTGTRLITGGADKTIKVRFHLCDNDSIPLTLTWDRYTLSRHNSVVESDLDAVFMYYQNFLPMQNVALSCQVCSRMAMDSLAGPLTILDTETHDPLPLSSTNR
jgi:hypothetical protein